MQRELPRSLAIEANYTGWRGAHQFVDSFIRLNAVPVDNLSYRDQLYDDAFRNSLRPFPHYRNLNLGGVFPGGDVEIDERYVGGKGKRGTKRGRPGPDSYKTLVVALIERGSGRVRAMTMPRVTAENLKAAITEHVSPPSPDAHRRTQDVQTGDRRGAAQPRVRDARRRR